MKDPLQIILQSGNVPANQFPVTSRYYRIETTTLKTGGGKTIACLRRRFIPPPESLSLTGAYHVKQGDRLDNIAAGSIGDPEQFWQLADANNAMKPEELTDEPGKQLLIAQSQNIPGL
ncbi:MAG: LysM peptidoglycan-binding domain-containing protein [Chitinophagaceae bacterium]|nr:LysM peptidoglycan-binding domain-containing protein [Chitinophagaceae bacterium]MCW5926535.1 LysM peptidoglycan-binding domain-containing protein [Chitinophagaceae bacterium]